MSEDKFRNQYRIKSARATWHDYGGGTYFITVCTKNRECFFGEIVNEEMELSEIGKFLYDNLQNITDHYSYVEIPLFVVMPNHWHAVIFVDAEKTPYIRRDCIAVDCNESMQNIANLQGWLSVAIGGVKSAVTKFANANHVEFAWQTRFHDHIIRDVNQMNRIVDYIENNVATWDTDCFNE